MTWPALVQYEIDQPSFYTQLVGGRLILQSAFHRGSEDLRASLFVAYSVNQSVNTCRSLDRYFLQFRIFPVLPTSPTNLSNALANLPVDGESLLFRCVECGVNNGQFFYPTIIKSIVGVQPYVPANILYGLLYNPLVAGNIKNFVDGWHVPLMPNVNINYNCWRQHGCRFKS